MYVDAHMQQHAAACCLDKVRYSSMLKHAALLLGQSQIVLSEILSHRVATRVDRSEGDCFFYCLRLSEVISYKKI